jgi:branched-chain amino acid transport system substrate-binding protein
MGSIVAGGMKAVQAWASRINATGGLRCHPVKYVVADDGGDAARNRALVQRLVETEKVLAFVYNGGPVTAAASASYLNEKGIPAIGQEGGHMFTYESPMHFPIGAAAIPIQRMTLAGGAGITVGQGKTKAAIVTCQEVEYCNVADKTYAQYAKDVGYEIVYTAKTTFTQPDFTSICVAAQNAGAQVLLLASDANSHQRMMANCIRVNYRPTDVVTTIQASTDFKDDPNMDGTVIVSNVLPWFWTQNPVIAEYQATVKKYAPGQPFDAVSMNGYSSAKAFEKALSTIAPDHVVTTADVLDGLYRLDGDDLGGIVGRLRFTRGKPAKEVACGWTVVAQKGQFVSDGKMFCVKGLEP